MQALPTRRSRFAAEDTLQSQKMTRKMQKEESASALGDGGQPEPKEPSPTEVNRHNLTHLPYRSWCPHCVAARRANAPHARGSQARQKPLFCLDYCSIEKAAPKETTSRLWWGSCTLRDRSLQSFANAKVLMMSIPLDVCVSSFGNVGSRTLCTSQTKKLQLSPW